MIQKDFALRAVEILRGDPEILGIAAAGSWLSDEMDAYSDLDLVIVTENKIGGYREPMLNYAKRLGTLLSGFTGEHVGEPRLLICMYDEPLLHVDLKFVTLQEFYHRVEDPCLLLDKEQLLKAVLDNSKASFPIPDFQWIEDRFWTWVHYALLKIGRGEYMEAFDFFATLRMMALGPLVHLKNGNLPRGLRRVESQVPQADLALLKATLPSYDRASLLQSLSHALQAYRQLRTHLYPPHIKLYTALETKVMQYFEETQVKAQDFRD